MEGLSDDNRHDDSLIMFDSDISEEEGDEGEELPLTDGEESTDSV